MAKKAYRNKITFQLKSGEIMVLAKVCHNIQRHHTLNLPYWWEIIQPQPSKLTAGWERWKKFGAQIVWDEIQRLNISSLSNEDQMSAYCMNSYPGGDRICNMKRFYSIVSHEVQRVDWNSYRMEINAYMNGGNRHRQIYKCALKSEEDLAEALEEIYSIYANIGKHGEKLEARIVFRSTKNNLSTMPDLFKFHNKAENKDFDELCYMLGEDKISAALDKIYETWELSGRKMPVHGLVAAHYDDWNTFRIEWREFGYSDEKIAEMLASDKFISLDDGSIVWISQSEDTSAQ